MIECPQCGSSRFTRVHARSYERALRSLVGLVPYRCQQCGWHDWQRRREHRKAFALRTAALGIGVTVVALALISFVLMHQSTSMPTTVSSGRDVLLDAAPRTTSLRLLSSSAYLNPAGNLWHIVGEVENIGHESLTNVQVVSTWLDNAGAIVESHEDLVDLKRLMPGEVSTFMAVTRAKPEMSTFRLEFESQVGEALPTSTQ